MTRMMKAYQHTGPHQAQVVELPVPEPGPGQVRLRIAGAGLCHSDLTLLQADPPYFPLPKILGHEATGWIDKLGAHVTGLNVDQAYGVYFPRGCGHCQPCGHGAENICDDPAFAPGFGTGLDGGMAEYVIIDDPRHLVPLGGLDPIAAAPLMCAGITSYNAIRQVLPLLVPGSAAVVIGIGGLGHVAVQILKALSPTRIIAVDAHQDKLDHALALGAAHGVLAGPDAVATVRAYCGGRGAAVVLDLVGSDATLAFAAAVVGQAGHIKFVGAAGGIWPLSFGALPREAGISVTFAGTIPDLRQAVQLADDGHIHAEVIRIGFDELDETFALMDTGRLRGRAVLVPGQQGDIARPRGQLSPGFSGVTS